MDRTKDITRADTGRLPEWHEIRKRPRWISLLVFIVGVVAFTVIESVYYATGNVDALRFLIDFLVYTPVVLVVVLVLDQLMKAAWRKTYTSEQRRLTIEDISTDAVFSLGPKFTITAWSRGAEKIFGYAEDEVIGESLAVLMPDDHSVEQELAGLEELVRDGSVSQFRTSRKRKGGEVFTAETSASLLKSPGDEFAGIISVTRDVSWRAEMEDKLKKSEERYRDLYESSMDGIVSLDTVGRLVECNRAFAEMLGYEPDELEKLTYMDITPREWHEVDWDIVTNQLLESGYSDEYTKENIRKDGTVFPVSVRAWRVDDDDGNPIGAWCIVRDISERKQYESFIRDTMIRLEEACENLQQIDRLKTEFVAMVTHELRAPLGAIESGLGALRSVVSGAPSADAGELLKILDRGVQRLSGLIEDLLDITRIESGQLKLNFKQADLSYTAARVVHSYEQRFAEKGLCLDFKQSEEPCLAMYDPVRMEQVLTNLVDNALKFTEKGGVTVRVERRPDRVLCSVADSGPGIPPEVHRKIFDKFFSLEVPQENEKQGIGLGLAICRGIIEGHGGAIRVESRRGAGSTFSFDIPREQSPGG